MKLNILIVEDERRAAEDFSILARSNEGKESVFCVIANQKKVNLSWDSIENRKCIRNFAWEEQFEASKNRKYYYKLTRDNVQYFACQPDLIWTYKMYYDSGKTQVSCFYKGHWERVKKCDINTLTFLLESGIELLTDIPCLAPGDFRTVRQSLFYLGGETSNAERLFALEQESRAKTQNRFARRQKIGF